LTEDGIRFGYWTDPLCVWAFVAESKLRRLFAEFQPLLEVEYRVVPVFGSLPWRFSAGPWADAGPEGRAQATREICACHGFDAVTGAVWVDDTPASSWSPGMAIKAAFAVEDRGRASAGAGADFQWRLREAFFIENRNIARRSVQLEIAEACGLPVGDLEAALDDGTALALLWEDHHLQEQSYVRGSPTYVFDGGREILYGNVAEEIIRATIEALRRGVAAGRSEC
jgi:predicted DsbA family dithiol-disulfide isomerase